MTISSSFDGFQKSEDIRLSDQFQDLVKAWGEYIEGQEQGISENKREALAFNAATVLALPRQISLQQRREVIANAHTMLELGYQVKNEEHFSFLQGFAKNQGIPSNGSHPFSPILHKRALVSLVEGVVLSQKTLPPIPLQEQNFSYDGKNMNQEGENSGAEHLAMKFDLPPKKRNSFRESPFAGVNIAKEERVIAQQGEEDSEKGIDGREFNKGVQKMTDDVGGQLEKGGKQMVQQQEQTRGQSIAASAFGAKKKKMTLAAAAGWGTGSTLGAVWLSSGGDDTPVAFLQTAINMFC